MDEEDHEQGIKLDSQKNQKMQQNQQNNNGYMAALCERYPHMAHYIQLVMNNDDENNNNGDSELQNVREFLHIAAKREDVFRVPVFVGTRTRMGAAGNPKYYIGHNKLLGRVFIDNTHSACPLEPLAIYLCNVQKCGTITGDNDQFGGCAWRAKGVLALMDEGGEEKGKMELLVRVQRVHASHVDCMCTLADRRRLQVRVRVADLRERCAADLVAGSSVLRVICFPTGLGRSMECCFATIDARGADGEQLTDQRRCCAQIHQVYDLLDRLFRHNQFRTRFLNKDANSDFKRKFLRVLMRDDQ